MAIRKETIEDAVVRPVYSRTTDDFGINEEDLPEVEEMDSEQIILENVQTKTVTEERQKIVTKTTINKFAIVGIIVGVLIVACGVCVILGVPGKLGFEIDNRLGYILAVMGAYMFCSFGMHVKQNEFQVETFTVEKQVPVEGLPYDKRKMEERDTEIDAKVNEMADMFQKLAMLTSELEEKIVQREAASLDAGKIADQNEMVAQAAASAVIAAFNEERKNDAKYHEAEERIKADEALRAEQHAIIEEMRAQMEEDKRKAAEEAARMEEERLKYAEEARLHAEEVAKHEEAIRLANEEAIRLEEAARLASEETARLEEEYKLAEERRKVEEEERRKATEAEILRIEEERRAAEAEATRIIEEMKLAEERRLAEEAERARLEEERKKAEEEAARIAEEMRIAEEKRLAEEAERARLEEERRLAEEAERLRLEEERRKAEEEAARIAEEIRLAEERKAAEEAAIKAEKERLASLGLSTSVYAWSSFLGKSEEKNNEPEVVEASEPEKLEEVAEDLTEEVIEKVEEAAEEAVEEVAEEVEEAAEDVTEELVEEVEDVTEELEENAEEGIEEAVDSDIEQAAEPEVEESIEEMSLEIPDEAEEEPVAPTCESEFPEIAKTTYDVMNENGQEESKTGWNFGYNPYSDNQPSVLDELVDEMIEEAKKEDKEEPVTPVAPTMNASVWPTIPPLTSYGTYKSEPVKEEPASAPAKTPEEERAERNRRIQEQLEQMYAKRKEEPKIEDDFSDLDDGIIIIK